MTLHDPSAPFVPEELGLRRKTCPVDFSNSSECKPRLGGFEAITADDLEEAEAVEYREELPGHYR